MNDDLISRSALKEEFAKHEDRKGYLIGDWEDIIDNAPPVDIKPFALFSFDKDELERIVDERVIEPIKNGELVVKTEARPQGEWIIDGHHYKCSRCGKTLAIMFSETDDGDLIGCPFCLADMRVNEGEE